MQIIPAIDIRDGKCVRLRQGDYSQETVFSDDPVDMARQWCEQGAGRLHLVDLDGAKAGRTVNIDVVKRIVRSIRVPCQLGGGIRDEASLHTVLETVGVDRAIVGTQALRDPDWFREMVRKWPGRIVLGIDARDSMVATKGWLDVSQTPAFDLAASYAGLEVAAIVYTNIANDGMMQGIDPATLDDLGKMTKHGIPVIASGGVAVMDDIKRLVDVSRKHPGLVGVIVGRAIYEGTVQLPDAMRVACSDPTSSESAEYGSTDSRRLT